MLHLSGSYFTDYTKAKNYNKRAHKLLKWFETLLSKPAVLRDKTFQKGIHLPKHLADKMTEIAIDWANRDRCIKMSTKTGKPRPTRQSDRYSNGQNGREIQKIRSRKQLLDDDELEDNEPHVITSAAPNSMTTDPDLRVMSQQQIDSFLTKLQQDTEELLVDVTFEQESMAIHSGNYDAAKIDAAKCFHLSEVLPPFLMPNDPLRSEPFDDNKLMINRELLRMMDGDYRKECEKHLESVDKIAYEIRDLILSNCELLKE